MEIGDEVDGYVVDAFLGAGGMASVYRARHRALGSLHAIKVLRPDLARSAQIRERFLHEGRVLAQVRHPGLVRVTDVVDAPGVAGLVMDFLDGRDLELRLRDGPLSETEAAGLMLQILSTVGLAHRAGVIHRDLKPANLFLVEPPGRSPVVKVLDFGIAKLRGLDQTRSDGVMGTVAYMSPEQLEDPASVDARSDLFALGVVLYEMVSGAVPFPGTTDYAVMTRIVEGDATPLPEHVGSLAPIIRRALQTEPDARFPDAAGFAAALRDLAPPEVVAMVDGWEGSWGGSVEVEPPASPPPWTRPPPTTALPAPDERRGLSLDVLLSRLPELPDATVVRTAGALQLASGLFDLMVMSVIQCFGLGWLGGLPACFGLLLFAVGTVEIASGLRTLLTGHPGWIRRTALIEIVALAGGGIVAALVGGSVLLAARRYRVLTGGQRPTAEEPVFSVGQRPPEPPTAEERLAAAPSPPGADAP